MPEDPFDELGIFDERDDPHRGTTVEALERVDLFCGAGPKLDSIQRLFAERLLMLIDLMEFSFENLDPHLAAHIETIRTEMNK